MKIPAIIAITKKVTRFVWTNMNNENINIVNNVYHKYLGVALEFSRTIIGVITYNTCVSKAMYKFPDTNSAITKISIKCIASKNGEKKNS